MCKYNSEFSGKDFQKLKKNVQLVTSNRDTAAVRFVFYKMIAYTIY